MTTIKRNTRSFNIKEGDHYWCEAQDEDKMYEFQEVRDIEAKKSAIATKITKSVSYVFIASEIKI